uniref:Retrotransposon protein, putative, unclassified n=1 Tax=Oryza sativa subsp. japonica TaxID=39947 RepID=Q2QMV0_ORYSJ|nr:retrotransposon protein, putative, unclassified [Oryza sativa Japonica Group]
MPENQPIRQECWTSKPLLTPSLEAFANIIGGLREQGLTGYEVAQDFIAQRIQPLQARAHPAFHYEGALDVIRISSRDLSADVVTQRVRDVLINLASEANELPTPLCDKPVADMFKKVIYLLRWTVRRMARVTVRRRGKPGRGGGSGEAGVGEADAAAVPGGGEEAVNFLAQIYYRSRTTVARE